MKLFNTQHIKLALAFSGTLTLVACGGGGGNDPVPPPAPELSINKSNYDATAGIAMASVERGVKTAAVGSLPQNPQYSLTSPNEFSCDKGGKLLLNVADQKRTLTAVDCQLEQFTLVSGQLIDAPGLPDTPNERTYELQNLVLRADGAQAPLATIKGSFSTPKKSLNANYVLTGDFTILTDNRSDTFAFTLKQDGSTLLVLSTPKLKDKLVINADAQGKTVSVTSRSDGSSVTLKESADGKSIQLELRGPGNAAVIESKTLSKAEWEALLSKSQ